MGWTGSGGWATAWKYYGGTPADLDRYQYGYDRNSNRLWKQNMVATTGFDEQYGVDDLNRLKEMKRGTLDSSHVIPGTPVKEQGWDLDPVGNWSQFYEEASGTAVLDQARTTSTVNEITSIGTNTVGLPVWATPTYDAAGNMTGVVKPSKLTANLTAVYDAWNRLMTVSDGTKLVAAYAYDGLKRRVVKKSYSGGTLTETRDFYFSDQWQVLSEVVGKKVDKTYVWGLRYVDELLWRNDAMWKSSYAMQDANFNCTSICDKSGTVTERYQFDPCGGRAVLKPSWSPISASAYDWTVAHQGLMLEIDVGLYNCRNRVYSPRLGVWLQRDPLGYVDGMNLYECESDSPTQVLDPSAFGTKSSLPFNHNKFGAHYTFRVNCNGSIIKRSGWGRVDDIMIVMSRLAESGCCVEEFSISTHHIPGIGSYSCDSTSDAVPDSEFASSLVLCDGASVTLNSCNACQLASAIKAANPDADGVSSACTKGDNWHHPGWGIDFTFLTWIPFGAKGKKRKVRSNKRPDPSTWCPSKGKKDPGFQWDRLPDPMRPLPPGGPVPLPGDLYPFDPIVA